MRKSKDFSAKSKDFLKSANLEYKKFIFQPETFR